MNPTTWSKDSKKQEVKRKAKDAAKGAKYVPRYERNSETDDGIKKYNQHDKSIYPSAQKSKLMKAEIADKIQRGKLPAVQGVKDLQHLLFKVIQLYKSSKVN